MKIVHALDPHSYRHESTADRRGTVAESLTSVGAGANAPRNDFRLRCLLARTRHNWSFSPGPHIARMGCCSPPATAPQRLPYPAQCCLMVLLSMRAIGRDRLFVEGEILFFGRSSTGGFWLKKVKNALSFDGS
jgi:hypothetical protein